MGIIFIAGGILAGIASIYSANLMFGAVCLGLAFFGGVLIIKSD